MKDDRRMGLTRNPRKTADFRWLIAIVAVSFSTGCKVGVEEIRREITANLPKAVTAPAGAANPSPAANPAAGAANPASVVRDLSSVSLIPGKLSHHVLGSTDAPYPHVAARSHAPRWI
jgi:hypothetical protein